MTQIEWLLPYFIPPLLGAFIGYVTNYIAIRMLFRPLRPWRILGVRLPLTPGIIPSKRFELAEKMGDMVGSHLLTSEDVGRALERDGFRRELQGVLGEKLGAFLDRDLGTVDSLVPPAYRDRFQGLIDWLRWRVVRIIFDTLESPGFAETLHRFLRHRGNELLARDLESFLTPERYETLRQHLDERLTALLNSQGMEKAVAAFIDGKMEELVQSQRPIRELLPADLVDLLFAQLEKEIPPLLDKFSGLLYDPVFREKLTQRALTGIDKFLDSLQGFAGILSGLVNIDKLKARLPEFFDQASDEISKYLREERTQKQVSEILRQRIEALLDRSVSSFLEGVPYEKMAEVRRFVRVRSVKMLHSRKAAEYLLASFEQGLGKLKDRPFGALLNDALTPDGVERAFETMEDRILAALRSGESRQFVERMLGNVAQERLLRRPLGRLSARLPADLVEEIEAALFSQFEDLLKREVPPLVETLNVRRMVTDKVNSLDILKVEGLLLGIMQEQFKYINLFGALLGFFIGLLNLAFFFLV
jgi:uncharacterized membrane protein YheB (UPF0754 family)